MHSGLSPYACQNDYFLTPARMAVIDKTGDHKGWCGCGEKGTLVHCWQVVTWTDIMKNSMEEPQKI